MIATWLIGKGEALMHIQVILVCFASSNLLQPPSLDPRAAAVPIIIVAVIIFVGIICFTVYKCRKRSHAQVRLLQIKDIIIVFFCVFFSMLPLLLHKCQM